MTKKRFHFGVDIPAKMEKYNRRFTDLEGFLDEHYDQHILWDNQDECWVNLDEALECMEKEYYNIKKENEQLKSTEMEYEDALGRLEEENEKLKLICQDHRDHAHDFKADCVRLEKADADSVTLYYMELEKI